MNVPTWLRETLAGDVMVREVATLGPEEPLAAAASLLLQHQISGAPVVDAAGRCVGVISASDFLSAETKAEREREKIAESSLFHSHLALPSSVFAAQLAKVRDKLVPAAEQPVSRFMTTDTVGVAAGTSLEQVVRHMVDAHIHRVLVIDPEQKLLGLITTTDVLAALLREEGTSTH